jgi:endonuclease/exonuclease/phosphatase family metal-dependent hydrolase
MNAFSQARVWRRWALLGVMAVALMAWVWFCVSRAVAPAQTPPVAALPGNTITLRLATYNVRNYNMINRPVNGGYQMWPKPESEKTALRAVICSAHPDILAIQEMGNVTYLEELRHDLAAEGLTYSYTALVNGPDPDRHVALLSRVPLAQVNSHEKINFKLNGVEEQVLRGLLEVDFVTNGQPWALYVVHLKSRLTETAADPQSAVEREGEARTVRDIIRKEQPLADGARVAVVGDFNDARDSVPLRRFLELDGKPLFHLVTAVDSRGETWTSAYGRADEYDSSDYILFSPALLPWQKGPGGVADIPESKDASDHRLVWVDLAFPAAETKK